jgi:hypothetical protein
MDPSGNVPCHLLPPEDQGRCSRIPSNPLPIPSSEEELYGVHFAGEGWQLKHMKLAIEAINDVGKAFSKRIGGTYASAFRTIYKTYQRPLYFYRGNDAHGMFWTDGSGTREIKNDDGSVEVINNFCEIGTAMCTVGFTNLTADSSRVSLIKFVSTYANPEFARNNFVHELGHLYNRTAGNLPYLVMGRDLDKDALLTEDCQLLSRKNTARAYGFASAKVPWQIATVSVNEKHEIFADQFLGWVYGRWEEETPGTLTDRGQARSDWMENHMNQWLHVYNPWIDLNN